jgi:site-specific DNA recombinase
VRGRTRSAVLYARVSTDEQTKGYSLRQQLEALRSYAASEGYDVVEECEDPGYSGMFLDRPGLDRARDLVEAGGVAVVLAQDADRITRKAAHRLTLDEEAARYGARWIALDDWGDDSHEGKLL